jgi:hypothetical protein
MCAAESKLQKTEFVAFLYPKSREEVKILNYFQRNFLIFLANFLRAIPDVTLKKFPILYTIGIGRKSLTTLYSLQYLMVNGFVHIASFLYFGFRLSQRYGYTYMLGFACLVCGF